MSPHRLSCCSPLHTGFCKSARWLPPPPTATKHVPTARNYVPSTAKNKTRCKSKNIVQLSGSSFEKRLADSNSAISNQLNSPLLRLPGEIRTTIYTYVCISTTVNHGHLQMVPKRAVPLPRLSYLPAANCTPRPSNLCIVWRRSTCLVDSTKCLGCFVSRVSTRSIAISSPQYRLMPSLRKKRWL